MANKKLQVWLPLIFSGVMVAGMYLGYGLNGGDNFFRVERKTSLQEAVDVIDKHYVDPINTDSLEKSAIEQMIGKLDPHSLFLPPVELKAANEELEGNFEGIGVEFNIFSDTVNIVYVIPDGPSDKAGLATGDKLLMVNDSNVTGTRISTDRIKELIRGQEGTAVKLTILRDNRQKTATVTRGRIPVPSVDAWFMIDGMIGYIKLNKFTRTSYREFMSALEALQRQGMKKLIYDLRGNGGGFMEEAINMADEFLDRDKLIVYTEGVNNPKREYRCRRPGIFEKGNLVLLVDELSASATEVLAGAVQDWERATIIGRRTFGKGLVQEQFQLSDGSAIRLTIARYYTPLGRSIQRPYDHGKQEYMDEIWQRYSNGEALYADSNKVNTGKEFRTIGGKRVYGGGGIMPDIFVPIDTSGYPLPITRMLVDGSFNSFVFRYFLQHRAELNAYQSTTEFIRGFKGIPDMWNQFVNQVPRDSADLSRLTARQKESLQLRMEAYLARLKWRNTGLYQVLNHEDPAFNRAIEELRKSGTT